MIIEWFGAVKITKHPYADPEHVQPSQAREIREGFNLVGFRIVNVDAFEYPKLCKIFFTIHKLRGIVIAARYVLIRDVGYAEGSQLAEVGTRDPPLERD